MSMNGYKKLWHIYNMLHDSAIKRPVMDTCNDIDESQMN